MEDKFPERLRKLRERDRKSRKMLSELCGLSPGTIRRYERGERKPGVSELISIADYFGVSVDYLLGRED